MSNRETNFYSDTQTRPTRAMLETALTAEVGDEQSGRDPTTNALCERVAALLGHEAAVFLPSAPCATRSRWPCTRGRPRK